MVNAIAIQQNCMPHDPNPYEATQVPNCNAIATYSRSMRALVYLAFGFVGLGIGSCISVYVGNFWYPTEATGDVLSKTIAAIIFSPIAMTLGILPSLGFYGPFHGLLMLAGLSLTTCATWMYFRSGRSYYAWLVCIGMIFWSHNNHLAINAIMSV